MIETRTIFLDSVTNTVSFVEIETSCSTKFPIWCNHRFLIIIKANVANMSKTSLVIVEFVVSRMIVIGTSFSTCPFLIACRVIFCIYRFQGEFGKNLMIDMEVDSSVILYPCIRIIQINFRPFKRRDIQPETLTPHSFNFMRLCRFRYWCIGVTDACVDMVSMDLFVFFNQIIRLVWCIFYYHNIQ